MTTRLKWNRTEVVATTIVCAATVGFTIWATTLYTSQPEPVSEPISAGVESVTPTEPRDVGESITYSVSPDATGPSLGQRDSYQVQATEPPAPVNVVPPAAAPESGPSVPACLQEDGSGQDLCYWDAQTMGNGQGMSFIVMDGKFYYLEGSGLNTRIEGDPFALWPKAPVAEYDPGVLMCGTGAAPAEDTDPNGNHWAYCEPALVTQ
jgi:hypothetical protein